MKLAKPTNVSVPERAADQFRIAFDLVADATTYTARVNGNAWPDALMPGDWLSGLSSNSEYGIELRASAVGHQDSDWSPIVATATRPPTPARPMRVQMDLATWGIVLEWDIALGWPGDGTASAQLWRSDNFSNPVLLEDALNLKDRRVDTTYPAGVTKAYYLRTTAPSALFGQNASEFSNATEAIGPIGIAHVGSLPTTVEAAQIASTRMTHRLLGLPRWGRE
jgi:hypothetical protein